MKLFRWIAAFLICAAPAFADGTANQVIPGYMTMTPQVNCPAGPCFVASGSTGGAAATGSTLTSGPATSLTTGQLIASSATAGSIVVPSVAVAAGNGASSLIPKAILWTNATSGWSSGTVNIELYSAAPTFTNGDGGTYAVATGSAGYLGTMSCTFGQTYGSATVGQAGDGAYAECVPLAGTVMAPHTASARATVFWTLYSTSTLTKAGGATFTFTPMSSLN